MVKIDESYLWSHILVMIVGPGSRISGGWELMRYMVRKFDEMYMDQRRAFQILIRLLGYSNGGSWS